MSTEEMIKVMQHYVDGGVVESKEKGADYTKWRGVSRPFWDWDDYEYRIKEEKQKITIEKWLSKNMDSGEYFTMESSAVDLTLQNFPEWQKVKLLDTYEVEL